jgi:hypothetical protein
MERIKKNILENQVPRISQNFADLSKKKMLQIFRVFLAGNNFRLLGTQEGETMT